MYTYICIHIYVYTCNAHNVYIYTCNAHINLLFLSSWFPFIRMTRHLADASNQLGSLSKGGHGQDQALLQRYS